jgi:predicted ester cyclase
MADSDVIRRLTNEVFINGDLSHWDDLVDDTFVDHDPMPGVPNDKKGQRQVAEMVLTAFSDRKMAMDEMVDTTDGRVVENWIMAGQHTGDMMGIPPSNEEVRVRGIELWRVANGKVVEHWGVVDIGDMLEKAGLTPG